MTSHELSSEEMHVLQDRTFMPLKARVCRKVETMLSDTFPLLEHISLAGELGEQLRASTPKISKGENYHSYAYRLLDYPRIFRGDDMFLFRVMMLWGHHLSIHLILSGFFQAQLVRNLYEARHNLDRSWYLDISSTPWNWTPATHEQRLFTELPSSEDPALLKRPFFKISQYHPLSSLAQFPQMSQHSWQELTAYF